MMPSAQRNPSTSSRSCPGVRIVMARVSPEMRISRGSSTTTWSSRPSRAPDAGGAPGRVARLTRTWRSGGSLIGRRSVERVLAETARDWRLAFPGPNALYPHGGHLVLGAAGERVGVAAREQVRLHLGEVEREEEVPARPRAWSRTRASGRSRARSPPRPRRRTRSRGARRRRGQSPPSPPPEARGCQSFASASRSCSARAAAR